MKMENGNGHYGLERHHYIVQEYLLKAFQAAFTRQRFIMNMVTLVFVFTEGMQHLHVVVLSAEVNYAHGMWACCFWQALKVQHDALQKMQLRVDRHRSKAFANLSCEYEG